MTQRRAEELLLARDGGHRTEGADGGQDGERAGPTEGPEAGPGRVDAGATAELEGGTPEEVRGHLYGRLDVLAFALEKEAAVALEEGREEEAVRLQDRRLGIRLAQRLVSGVWADEVDLRLQRWAAAYEERLRASCSGPSTRESATPTDV